MIRKTFLCMLVMTAPTIMIAFKSGTDSEIKRISNLIDMITEDETGMLKHPNIRCKRIANGAKIERSIYLHKDILIPENRKWLNPVFADLMGDFDNLYNKTKKSVSPIERALCLTINESAKGELSSTISIEKISTKEKIGTKRPRSRQSPTPELPKKLLKPNS